MLYNYFTENLIGLQGLIAKKLRKEMIQLMSMVSLKEKPIFVLNVETRQKKFMIIVSR